MTYSSGAFPRASAALIKVSINGFTEIIRKIKDVIATIVFFMFIPLSF
jgi:hypothetical protein